MREGAGFNWCTGALLIFLILGYEVYQFRDLFTVFAVHHAGYDPLCR